VKINASYEPFSAEPEYIEVNRKLVQCLGLWPGMRILDLACGTGVLSLLVIDEFEAQNPDNNQRAGLAITGVDISRESLELARRALTRRNPQGTWDLLEASADQLPMQNGGADTAIMGNAIHIFADKDALLREIHRVLQPKAVFAFNSSFYAGTFVPGTEQFYTEWLKEALTFIRQKNQELQQSGRRRIARRRGQASPAFSQRWLSAEEYCGMLNRHGFGVRQLEERTVLLSQHSFETVGAYTGLAQVLLSGYPARLASEALMKSVGAALATVGMEQVPRHWLEIVAVKQ
jgi:ubiquinone/menaquinone biosynthesis C-methylase UbiE